VQPRVPKRFVAIAEDAVLHRDSAHAVAYRVLWRLTHGEPGLLDDAADPDVRALVLRAKGVTRDLHKMHAFVRFRQDDDEDGEPRFVAWHQPDHHILERAAEFFVDRFASMTWSILTPEASAHWDGEAFVPRRMMNLSSSFDHRVIDGWDAALFVQRIRALLETPALIFIER
jgi:DNA polymerase